MFRLLIILSAIPIIVTFGIRWWFGLRVISSFGRRECQCDLQKWQHTFGEKNLPVSKNAESIVFAEHLYQSALAEWRERDVKTAASREGTRRFGMAVPPLAAMCALLGMIVGRIPPIYVIAIFLCAIATASILSYLSLAPELRALLITTRRLRDSRIFPRSDDEEAVIQATTALAWKNAAPPVFNLVQR